MKETLAGLDTEGAGRTSSITGSMTIDGTTVTDAEFTVDMTTFKSDDSRRDGQFNGRIMEVDTFPTATFALTAPIELGAIPADGESIVGPGHRRPDAPRCHQAGDLRAHRARPPTVGSASSAPPTSCSPSTTSTNPSNGFAETGDNGTLEIQVLFDRA